MQQGRAEITGFLKKRPLTRISGALFLAHAALTGLGATVLGQSAFISWAGAALMVLLDLCVWLSLRFADRRSAPLLLTSAWFLLLYALPRLSAFQLFPAQNIGFVALAPFSPTEIEQGLMYLVSGWLALWAGIWIGSRAIKLDPSPIPPTLPLVGIVAFALIALAADLYVSFVLNVSIFSTDPSRWGNRMAWVRLVFSVDVVLLAATVWLVVSRGVSRRDQCIAIILVLVWIGYNLLMGSRGGPFRVMVFVGFAAIALYGNPLVSWAKLTAVVVLAFLTSAALYPVGSVIRLIPSSGDQAGETLASDWFRPGLVSESTHSGLRHEWSSSPLVGNAAAAFSPLITRLGLVDYVIVTVSREPDRAVIDQYLTLSHGLKNFANNLVPGELFPSHDLMSSRVFTMAYRSANEAHVRSTFLSEPWTLWGFAWLKGGPIAGLVIIAVMGCIVQLGYAFVMRWSAPMFQPYVGATYLFVPVTGGLLQFWGIDHALTITAHFAISTGVMFAVVVGVSALFRRIRRV